jgi:acyl carrier protein
MTTTAQTRPIIDPVAQIIVPPSARIPETRPIDTLKVTRDFVIENFLFGDEKKLSNDTSFLEGGIIDSTGILELVNFLEEKFKITVEEDDIVPENFDTLKNIVGYLERKGVGK